MLEEIEVFVDGVSHESRAESVLATVLLIGQVMFKIALLLIVTIIAGFIPASMIIKKNTLDSILGR